MYFLHNLKVSLLLIMLKKRIPISDFMLRRTLNLGFLFTKVSPTEEKALRQWNIEDPVDAEEFSRNQQIEVLQGNRNPFVDFSDLIDRVESFQ